MMNPCIQNVPEGNVSILRGHSMAHSKQKCVRTCRSFATTVSQLKMCDFSGETFKDFEVL